jgi:Uma2 family endonuclease
MTAELAASQYISVEDYLAGEERAEQKHEYLAGVVYAMAGGTFAHSAIASNLLITLGAQLHGNKCRPLNSDMKLRIRLSDQTRFYYPDVQVVCRPNPPGDHFQDDPVLIFEVVSDSTRRIDEQEKRSAYLAIPTLNAYVLIEQDRPAATVWRRTGQGFVREDYAGADAVIAFGEIPASITLGDLREGLA